MRPVDRSLAMVAVLVLLASAAIGITIHLRSQAWEPDYGVQRPASTDAPDASAESGVIQRSPALVAKPRAAPSIAPGAPPAVGTRAARPRIGQNQPVARARPIPQPTVAESPPVVDVVVPAPTRRLDTGVEPPNAIVPPKVQGPTYIVRISALRNLTHATDVVARLARYGYRATIETLVSSAAATYLVVSEPLPRHTAERRAQALVAVGIATTMHDRDGERVQLVFGRFSNPEESEVAARRIRQRGYTAITLIEGGTMYVVHVGPYEKAQVDEVAELLSGGLYVVDVEPAP